VRFWLSLNFEPWDQLLELAKAAEECGFEGVVLPDHIVVPAEDTTLHPSGYPLNPAEPFLEPLIAFAAMASVTTRLRFLSDVIVVPLRDPFLLAKQLATLAILSRDRVVLGTGTGWLKEEFEAVGQGWHTRGKRMDEGLDIMVDFWKDGWAELRGRHFDLPRSGMFPVPSQPIPIWIGGHSSAAARRAARFDGYMPMRPLDDVCRAEFAQIDRIRQETGLTGPFERIAFMPEDSGVGADELAERDGIGSMIVRPWEQYSAMGYARKSAAAGKAVPFTPVPLAEKLAAADNFAERMLR
jgi:probable F420-dependent oxidoreductase